MKRYGRLWERVVAWDNLLLAERKARRGKRDRLAVRRFGFASEYELARLAIELDEGRYRPGPFTTHRITRPKDRLISAAPFRDRVVHHALMNVLEPLLDRRFHPHSYACRKGKGTHAASGRLQRLMGRNRWVLQMDVRRFFPSIDHEILKAKFRRLIKDPRVLALMDLMVDSSNPQDPVREWFPGDHLWTPLERRRGLPIGNLTSQWFANWMLDDLDHFVTSTRGFGDYVRYCDDFLVLSDDRADLKALATSTQAFLACERLSLHPEKVAVRPVRDGVTFVGYRTWATHRLLRKSSVHAFRRRVRWMQRAYARGDLEWRDVQQRLSGWIGHARQADSHRLLRRLSVEWRFQRGRAS